MPRARRGALGIPHYVLDYESRFRATVIDAFADSYASGETPIPCVAATAREVRRPARHGARPRGRRAGDRPLCGTRALPEGGRALFRAPTRARPELFPLRDDARPARAAALPARRRAQGARCARWRRSSASGRRQAGQPGHLLRAAGPLRRPGRAAAPGGDGAGRGGRRGGRVLGRHAGIVHYTVGQRRGLSLGSRPANAGEPLFVAAVDAATARVVVGPREALADAPRRPARRELARPTGSRTCPPAGCRLRRAPARPGRPSPPSCTRDEAARCVTARRPRARRVARAGLRLLRVRRARQPACSGAARCAAPWRRGADRRHAGRRHRRRDAVRDAPRRLDRSQGRWRPPMPAGRRSTT